MSKTKKAKPNPGIEEMVTSSSHPYQVKKAVRFGQKYDSANSSLYTELGITATDVLLVKKGLLAIDPESGELSATNLGRVAFSLSSKR